MSDTFDADKAWDRVCDELLKRKWKISTLLRLIDSAGQGRLTYIDLMNSRLFSEITGNGVFLTEEQAMSLINATDASEGGFLHAGKLSKFLQLKIHDRRHPPAGIPERRNSLFGAQGESTTPTATQRRTSYSSPSAATQGVQSSYQTPRSKTTPQQKLKRTVSCDAADDLYIEAMLKDIIGQEGIKEQVKFFRKSLSLDRKREELGKLVHVMKPPHMVFLGNPGTGKTSIARTVAILLKNMGVLSRGHLVEVQRSDLVGATIGSTGPKTQEKIDEARGGVLFIDEAYRLTAVGSEKDFGKEALEQLMQCMNDGDPVLIFAGYEQEMKLFLDANPGLFRRIQKQFKFSDYTCQELADIFIIKMEKMGFSMKKASQGDDMATAVCKLISSYTTGRQRSRMNGAIAEQMLQRAKEELDNRLDEHDDLGDEICMFSLQDIEQAVLSLKTAWVNYESLCKDAAGTPVGKVFILYLVGAVLILVVALLVSRINVR